MPAYTAKIARETFAAWAKTDAAEVARIQNDKNLTEDGRRNLLMPILERATKRHEEVVKKVAEFVEKSKADYERARPRAAQARAAFAKPERAAAVRSMLAGASVDELQRHTALALDGRDFAAAHGIRMAIIDRSATQPFAAETDLAPIIASLDAIAPPDAENTLADFVATKMELAHLIIGGPLEDRGLDELKRDPASVITRIRAAASVEDEGRIKYFGDDETRRLQILAGTVEAAA